MFKKFPLLFAIIIICTSYSYAQQAKMKSVFNGKNLKGWVVPESNIWYSASEGILSIKSGPEQKGSILWTKKKFKNFIVTSDFRFGDGTIDSGLFLKDENQQVQIGESGSLKRDMTGSVYVPGKGYPKEAKQVTKLLKSNDWNTISVKVEGNTFDIGFNGEHVLTFDVDKIEEKGPIGIQLHPSRDMHIDFRNIKVGKLKI